MPADSKVILLYIAFRANCLQQLINDIYTAFSRALTFCHLPLSQWRFCLLGFRFPLVGWWNAHMLISVALTQLLTSITRWGRCCFTVRYAPVRFFAIVKNGATPLSHYNCAYAESIHDAFGDASHGKTLARANWYWLIRMSETLIHKWCLKSAITDIYNK